MTLTLAVLSGWTPSALRSQATGLRGSRDQLARGRDTVQQTLDMLPTVWQGRAAAAVRDALRAEIDYVDSYIDAIQKLYTTYDDAATALVDALETLRLTLSRYASGEIVADLSSPAAGPVTVTANVSVSAASAAAGAGNATPSSSSGPTQAQLTAAASEIAAVAADVLRIDSDTARDLAALAAAADAVTAAAPNAARLKELMDTRSLAHQRYPEIPGIGHDKNAALRTLLLDKLPSGSLVDGALTFVENYHSNRVSFGDGLIDFVQNSIDDVLPVKQLGLGPLSDATKLLSGALWPEAAEGVGPKRKVFDAAVRPAARFLDKVTGLGMFVDDSDLTAKALRDSESFGGW